MSCVLCKDMGMVPRPGDWKENGYWEDCPICTMKDQPKGTTMWTKLKEYWLAIVTVTTLCVFSLFAGYSLGEKGSVVQAGTRCVVPNCPCGCVDGKPCSCACQCGKCPNCVK